MCLVVGSLAFGYVHRDEYSGFVLDAGIPLYIICRERWTIRVSSKNAINDDIYLFIILFSLLFQVIHSRDERPEVGFGKYCGEGPCRVARSATELETERAVPSPHQVKPYA